jgi:uncharacterized protein YjaZ
MLIEPIDALAGLRATLTAPADQRTDIFRAQVMEPLAPFWQPMIGMVQQQAGGAGDDDPALQAGRFFGFYGPDQEPETGLRGLATLEQAGTWDACRDAVIAAAEALRPADHGINLERVVMTLVLANPERQEFMERNYGYTGVGNRPGYLLGMIWPTDYNLPRMAAILVHEFHHNVRLSWEPFNMMATTVGQYVVLEGLAEAFAAARCGEDKLGPWATTLTPEELAPLRPIYRKALDVTGFNEIRGYIFGDWSAQAMGHAALGLPDFAGYAVGYRLVRAYLDRTGRSIEEATYTPWREIVEESGYL